MKNAFFAKLCELEQDDEMLRDCLAACQPLASTDLKRALKQVDERQQELNNLLESYICCGRSPAISALAQAQQTYYQTARQLTEDTLPSNLHSEASTPDQDQTEAQLLYAEYAIDFARQSICLALHAALTAVIVQQTLEKEASQ